jgi:TolB-like protein/DNA-binding winged helix-turn-helix (wHTH) protein
VSLQTSAAVRFGDFLLDRSTGGLFRMNGHSRPVTIPLGSRALDVLCVLVEHPGALVSRQVIMDAVWPGTAVEDNNLAVQISALRRVLDEGRADGSCIQTVPGRGYRFVVPIGGNDAVPHAQANQPNDADGDVVTDAPETKASAPYRGRRGRLVALLLTGAGLILSAVLLFESGFGGRRVVPPLSLVVLPFENLTGDPKDDYLVEGITEDITTDLSNVRGMFVIARASAYALQGKPIDVRRVGEELGVRYAIEGSVRKLDDTLRISAQLVSTETGAHLWADHLDQKLSDLNVGQDAIVRRIGQTLNVTLVDLEAARGKRERPTNPDAFDLILRARSLWLHPMGVKEHAERRMLLEQALRLDPRSIYALTQLAFEISREQVFMNAKGDDPDRAARLIAAAAAINPNDRQVLYQIAHLAYTNNRYSDAISAYQRLLDEYPNAHDAFYLIASSLIPLGRSEEAIPLFEKTFRYDPLSPWNYDRYLSLGFALLMVGREEESINCLQRALAASPSNYPLVRSRIYLDLAAAHARLGHMDEAHDTIAEANRAWPYATLRGVSPGYPFSPAFAEQMQRFGAALRLAGLRDHADADADFGVPADDNLRQSIPGLTPTTAPGATTIRTAELQQFLTERKPVVIDPLYASWGWSVPGAVGLKDAGRGGSTSDTMEDRLRKKMQALTKGDLSTPIVAVSWNVERFDGRNLALRLVALGYTNVYWYRGGREAWEVAGLPETPIGNQDW